jgi:hypothetical protein
MSRITSKPTSLNAATTTPALRFIDLQVIITPGSATGPDVGVGGAPSPRHDRDEVTSGHTCPQRRPDKAHATTTGRQPIDAPLRSPHHLAQSARLPLRRVAPDTRPGRTRATTFPLVRAIQGNGLRSRAQVRILPGALDRTCSRTNADSGSAHGLPACVCRSVFRRPRSGKSSLARSDRSAASLTAGGPRGRVRPVSRRHERAGSHRPPSRPLSIGWQNSIR